MWEGGLREELVEDEVEEEVEEVKLDEGFFAIITLRKMLVPFRLWPERDL